MVHVAHEAREVELENTVERGDDRCSAGPCELVAHEVAPENELGAPDGRRVSVRLTWREVARLPWQARQQIEVRASFGRAH